MQVFPIQFRINLKSVLFQFLIFLLVFGTVLAQAPVPSVQAQAGVPFILTKTVEGGITDAQVGDTIRYLIRFECSSLTGPCGPMQITDTLPTGLTYLPPPASSVPSGFSIAESPAGTITITKDDNNLLDGSQYVVTLATRVNYDLRPLPADIINTVTGRIDPDGTGWQEAAPSSAPPVHIGGVAPYWNITKTLFRPSVNPTVNTDVTYRVQLCPGTPPAGTGNAPIQDVVIKDTLPTGAVFVSASDAGVEAAGIVTWPTIAGPINPPTCITRYVTVQYQTPTFSVGNNVTNTASADGRYMDSTGGIIGPIGLDTDPLTHPIAAMVDKPTFNKNDQGDPVGFTGTARFVLTLNTGGTNVPSDDLILIDNLPPELQVLSVTSGQWNVAFNYVQATVGYSTDNGASWTAFGAAVDYNDNVTYTASVANITNVRWVFQYDPASTPTPPFAFTKNGLPYGWAFTTTPQIRVAPRAVATTTSTGVVMPAAVAGVTYTNCLWVSRTRGGAPITDACDNETMTVQGDLASLRVSKAETPGTTWDELGDPNISTFTSDTTILPGDTMRYRITINVTERSSQPLVNPTIIDTIPADLIFVRNGTAAVSGTGCPALVSQPNFSQPAAGQLQWDFPGLSLNRPPSGLGSCTLTVDFFARIPPGQTPGTRTNSFYIENDTDVVCEITGTTRDAKSCQATDNYVVERSAALRGEKWIRSTEAENNEVVLATTFLPDASCPNGGTNGLPSGGSNPFTRYPCISQAFPEGALSAGQHVPPPLNTALDDFEYNIRIFNDGNVDMLSYVLYDILPYYGDKGSGGTLASTPRLSEFQPILRGPVEFISGPGMTSASFTIEYNNTNEPCRPEVFNQPTGTPNVPAGCDNTWSSTWSAGARSFRIRLNSPAVIPPYTDVANQVRFGVPMYIPKDAPALGVFDNNDPLSREIAWNSFSHVGSYDRGGGTIQDLLASEPRKVGITIPERMSVGNRVWRDSDNSGKIDAPDDIAPGIAGVVVNLYRDVDNDQIPDGPTVIATTTTDSGGYYLFSNIPHDPASVDNNRYIIGIPANNFTTGNPLFNLRSSTGVFATADDSDDNGVDPLTAGNEVLSASFILEPTTESTGEPDLSSNDLDGPAGERRGTNAERDNNSDLAIDFGFFGGTDVPFSIGNHVWFDNGQTGVATFNYAQNNDGIRQTTEPPAAGVDVRLYRDGNGDNKPDYPGEMIRTDITDANGFYLFDNLDPGPYFVEIPASEFGAGQPLEGWNSSQVTGTENTGVPGNTNSPNMDSDDNGVDSNTPHVDGIFSGVIILTRGVNETTGESHISNEPDPDGNPATLNLGINPTEWDGPASRGRYNESDTSSNLTIDFGFFQIYSLGNVVWIDDGTGGGTADDGLRNGTEPGLNGVTINLYLDANNDGTPDTLAPKATTTTANGGYYRFDNLAADTYVVEMILPAGYASGPIDAGDPDTDEDDNDDNGVVVVSTSIVRSNPVTLGRGTAEPIADNDAATASNPEPGEAPNDHSNRTVDFTLTLGYSLGNRVWVDLDNSGTINPADGASPGLNNMTVNLYRASDLATIIATMQTSGGGYYRFDNLLAGDYVVEVVSPTGYTSSTVEVTDPNTDIDSDDNGVIVAATTVRSNVVTLGGVEPSTDNDPLPNPAVTGEAVNARSNRTVDFGFYFVPYSLGNRVWDDSDGAGGTPDNGIRDGAEPGMNGVTVNLYRDHDNNGAPDGAIIATENTAGGGYYRFDNLIADTYIVEVITPSGYASTLDAGDPDTDADDNDDNGVIISGLNVRSNSVTLGPPEPNEPNTDNDPALNPDTADGEADNDHSNRTVDFGFVLGYSLGNRVWMDDGAGGGIAKDGIRNGGEPGLDGFVVNLYRDHDDNSTPDGGIIATTTTSGGGFYRFDNLISDTYIVEVVSPSNYTSTLDAGDPDNDVDDDDNGVIISGLRVLSNPVTLGPVSVLPEPVNENNPTPNPVSGESPDNRSNRTVDFGFITSATPPPSGTDYSLGNRVWADIGTGGGTANDGIRNGTEPALDGITVNLYLDANNDSTPDGAAIATTITAGGGFYRFDRLTANTYIVEVIAPTGYTSSTVDAGDADVDVDDDDDNGVIISGNSVRSNPVKLGPGGSEPIKENNPAVNPETGEAVDNQSNRTVDFGFFFVPYSLGNRVWMDNGAGGGATSDGVRNGAEPGLDGITVSLYRDSDDNGTPDGAIINTMQTAGGGFYRFDNLAAGTYIVEVTSPTGYTSTVDAGDADTDVDDDDDNGVIISGSKVRSNPVTLGPGSSEPVGENNPATNPETGEAADDHSNRTVDFGFIAPPTNIQIVKTASVAVINPGDTVTYSYVVSNIGKSPISSVVVTDDKCSPVIYVSGDVNTNNILEITEQWTYTCSVVLKETTTNVATVTGIDTSNGNTVTDTDTVTVNTAETGLSKIITSTSETFTTGNNVAIGEIVTYKVTMNLPAGLPYNDVVITDRMDRGLAFVDCVSVTLAGTDITSQACPPTVTAIKDPIDLPGNPANPGRQAQFNIGDIPASATPTTLTVLYHAIVLDVIENQEKDKLNNSVTLTWTGGSFTTSAPEVIIIEPDLDIEKAADPTTVNVGDSIKFTLFITHTDLSSTDAFDVVVTDILPDGLEYITCTPITYTGVIPTIQPDPCNLPDGKTLQFGWDTLPLGGNATVMFFARYDGTKDSVMNSAAVAWTSLPIDYVDDKPVVLSEYNDESTERWYDPNDLVNIYQVRDNVWINAPTLTEPGEEELPARLPATGFAPNVITNVPAQPANKTYTDTDIWLEIPSIGVNMPIVGVPIVDGDWDLSWLWNEAGWLNGTAFPGWQGNSALTGHITLPNGRPGPFAMLGNLQWGDRIILHAYGTVYTYEVRENRSISPDNMYVLKHEDDSWLTLITCKTYDKTTNTYSRRTSVRAVLISTTAENSTEVKSGR